MNEKILVLCPNWLGDVLFATPVLRALRKKFPEAFITCLVHPRAQSVLAHNPYINEVLSSNFLSWVSIRSKSFTRALLLHSSRTKAFWMWTAGIPNRLGYATSQNSRFLSLAEPKPEKPLHKTEYFLRLLKRWGVAADGSAPDYFPRPEIQSHAQEILSKRGIKSGDAYAFVHPGGNWDLKRWPLDYFSRWTQTALERSAIKIVVGGTAREKALAQSIVQNASSARVVSLCGETSLDELAWIIRGAKFVLSNDSGPIHLSASQKTPIVGLFGPTRADLTGPRGDSNVTIIQKNVGCVVPCFYRSCNYRVCMEWISPEEVWKACEKYL